MNEAPDPPQPAPVAPTGPAAAPPAAVPAGASADEAKSPRKPGFIRKSAVIILAVVVLGFALSFPFVIEPWVVGQAKAALDAQGLELAPGSELSVSIFGLKLSGTNLKLHEKGDPKEVFTASELTADIALMDSIASGDVILDRVAIDGLSGDLRRRNGRVPILTPKDEGKPAEPTDWLKLGEQLMEWYRKYAGADEEKPADQPADKPADKPSDKPTDKPGPTAEIPTDWPQAKVYRPAPTPGNWPRVLIRELSISGKALGLPDDSPFDVTGFSVKGTNVALRLRPDEVMKLTADVTTKGSGPLDLALDRQGGKTGKLALNAKGLPIEALNAKEISNGALDAYGAKGLADLAISSDWTGWDLTSAIKGSLSKLTLKPTAQAGTVVRELADVVNQLDGRPLEWLPRLGGKLYAPVFTDAGLTSLRDSAAKAGAAAAVDKAKDKALEEGGKLLDKQLDKNPELKKATEGATDKAKDLLKGFGK